MKQKMDISHLTNAVQRLLADENHVQPIIDAIARAGGAPYLVGGAVRDILLGLPTKDIDIEVHGLKLDDLEKVLKQFGPVDLVGKAYGVLRVHPLNIDWSVPRADEPGRKPTVHMDPTMSISKAFERRDLTINAMGINVLNYELVDPFYGLNDLKHHILRATSPARFAEDPLRFYRVMQFMARFAMQPDKELNALCTTIDISNVSKERISEEFKKWLVKSPKPSLALDWLNSIGRLSEIMPEIAALQGVIQNDGWHPEGDVYEHTKQSIDAAAQLSYDSDAEKLLMMYAALTHDLGKAVMTEERDGRITSYGHEDESAILAKRLMQRITNDKSLIDQVVKLVKNHMHPGQFVKNNAKAPAYKKLAQKLAPELTMAMLAKLFFIDRLGRNPKKGNSLPVNQIDADVQTFIRKAEDAQVMHCVETPILHGRDLIPEIKPGPIMGKLVDRAYQIQLEEGITDKAELKKRVLAENK